MVHWQGCPDILEETMDISTTPHRESKSAVVYSSGEASNEDLARFLDRIKKDNLALERLRDALSDEYLKPH